MAVIAIAYIYAAAFYRASAREFKVSSQPVYFMEPVYSNLSPGPSSDSVSVYIWYEIIVQADGYQSDAILRSSLYSHFSESLSGLATIRAYGEVERFQRDNENRVDIENRAYWLTVANQV